MPDSGICGREEVDEEGGGNVEPGASFHDLTTSGDDLCEGRWGGKVGFGKNGCVLLRVNRGLFTGRSCEISEKGALSDYQH